MIWRTLAAVWPGGGYGFAASLGFVLVVCWALANSAHRRARWLAPRSWKAVGLWGLAGLGYTGALLCAVPVVALFPGRNGRPLGSTTDRPMWMEQHFDYCWGILPGALLASIPVVVKLLVQRGTGRRRRWFRYLHFRVRGESLAAAWQRRERGLCSGFHLVRGPSGANLSSAAQNNATSTLVLWVVSPVVVTLGILVAVNCEGAAERVFNFYASRVNPGWATSTTMRIVGGGWAFVGSMLLLPEVLKVIW